MAREVRDLIRRLQDSMNETLDALTSLSNEQLEAACSHPCGSGPNKTRSIWHLLANDIDHETIHTGQILSHRHDLGVMQTQTDRLLGEWLTKRAALIGALVGLADDDLDRRPQGAEWSIRDAVEHTLYWERDSLTAGLNDLAGGAPWRADPALEYGGPVPREKIVR